MSAGYSISIEGFMNLIPIAAAVIVRAILKWWLDGKK